MPRGEVNNWGGAHVPEKAFHMQVQLKKDRCFIVYRSSTTSDTEIYEKLTFNRAHKAALTSVGS